MKKLLAIAMLSVGFVGCSSNHPAAIPEAAATPATTKAAAPAPEFYQTSGPLVVENQVDVAAERDGVVAKIVADTGTRVHKGDLLAQLDDRQLTADHDAAVAKALAAEQDAKNWDTEIKIVETDLARDEEMYKYKLITQQQLEHSRYKLVGARQQREREVQNTREAESQAKSLELELAKTRIVAPFDGVVARRYIRAGQNVAKNDRLFWVTATDPINVRFTLPQELVAKIKAGEMVSVTAAGINGEHQAKVTQVSPVVDPASGTIEVQARLEGEAGELRPGMTVNVKVSTK